MHSFCTKFERNSSLFTSFRHNSAFSVPSTATDRGQHTLLVVALSRSRSTDDEHVVAFSENSFLTMDKCKSLSFLVTYCKNRVLLAIRTQNFNNYLANMCSLLNYHYLATYLFLIISVYLIIERLFSLKPLQI